MVDGGWSDRREKTRLEYARLNDSAKCVLVVYSDAIEEFVSGHILAPVFSGSLGSERIPDTLCSCEVPSYELEINARKSPHVRCSRYLVRFL